MLKNREIDLRKEFGILQNEFAIDILLIRATKYIRCKCFNALHQTGDPSCPLCMGSGHISSIEKVRGIQQGSPMFSGENQMRNTELGLASLSNVALYMKYDTLPKNRDLILYVGWDKNGMPQEVQKVYEIVSVKEIRGDNGRVELHGVNAKLRPEMLKTVQGNLSLLSHTAKQLIAKGKRYVWPLREISST